MILIFSSALNEVRTHLKESLRRRWLAAQGQGKVISAQEILRGTWLDEEAEEGSEGRTDTNEQDSWHLPAQHPIKLRHCSD